MLICMQDKRQYGCCAMWASTNCSTLCAVMTVLLVDTANGLLGSEKRAALTMLKYCLLDSIEKGHECRGMFAVRKGVIKTTVSAQQAALLEERV